MRQLLASCLRAAGFEVAEITADGPEALAAIERTQVDVLVTGLRMPGFHADALLAHLDEEGVEVPIVVCTAAGEGAASATMRRRAAAIVDKRDGATAVIAAVRCVAAARCVASDQQPQGMACTGKGAP